MDERGVAQGRPPAGQPDDPAVIDADAARHNGFFSGFGGSDNISPPPRRGRGRGRGRMAATIAIIAVLVVLAGGGAGAYVVYTKYAAAHGNYTGPGSGSVIFQVKNGQFAEGLAPELVKAGVIKSARPFVAAAEASGKTNDLEPGYFRLHKQMNAALAWALLINPSSRVQTKVTVPDGLRISKILPIVAKETGIPLAQFTTAIANTSALGLPSWAHNNPEGFLWPATYNFQPGVTALQVLRTMVAQFNTEIANMNLAAGAKRARFTEYQVIVTASLLEGEVPPQYYGKVSKVIDNRLNAVPEMTLGLDSTVAYALNKYIYDLSVSDLNVKSPYNTIKHLGLPPGPIDSPDAAAINAVLHPAHGNWIFFVTVNKSGKTLFTDSSTQIRIWDIEAQNNGLV